MKKKLLNFLNRVKLSILFMCIVKSHGSAKVLKMNGCPVHARKMFKNGYGFSIVGGVFGLYGDGIKSFEVAVMKGDKLCYTSGITEDVIGHSTLPETLEIIKQIKNLKSCASENA